VNGPRVCLLERATQMRSIAETASRPSSLGLGVYTLIGGSGMQMGTCVLDREGVASGARGGMGGRSGGGVEAGQRGIGYGSGGESQKTRSRSTRDGTADDVESLSKASF
jgi:hypothetical protein